MGTLLDEKSQLNMLCYLAGHHPTSFGKKLNGTLSVALASLKERGWIDYTVRVYRNNLSPLPHSVAITDEGLSYLNGYAVGSKRK